MKNYKKLALAVATSAAFIMSSGAQAAVLTFDDINVSGSNYVNLANYGGLNWMNTAVLNAEEYTPNSGYNNANVSGNNVAFNTYAEQATASYDISSNSLFNFVGANFTAAWRDNLNLTVAGYLNGVQRYTQTVTIQSDTAPNHIGSAAERYTFNFDGIDELRLMATGGTQNVDAFGAADPTKGIGGAHFAMDNFEYTPAPEPSTMVMGLMGLSSILGLRRNKKQA